MLTWTNSRCPGFSASSPVLLVSRGMGRGGEAPSSVSHCSSSTGRMPWTAGQALPLCAPSQTCACVPACFAVSAPDASGAAPGEIPASAERVKTPPQGWGNRRQPSVHGPGQTSRRERPRRWPFLPGAVPDGGAGCRTPAPRRNCPTARINARNPPVLASTWLNDGAPMARRAVSGRECRCPLAAASGSDPGGLCGPGPYTARRLGSPLAAS